MTMPHPRVMMIPMGCVILVETDSGGHIQLNFISKYTTVPPTLKPYMKAIFGDDDQDLTTKNYEYDPYAFVLNEKTINTSQSHFAYSLDAYDAKATPQRYTSFKTALVPGFYYFVVGAIIPDKKKKKKKKPGSSGAKKSGTKKK
jgi:hypothetical protein